MSKQKTPLAELIENLEGAIRGIDKVIHAVPHLKDTRDAYISCMYAAKKLLPKEREAIINAAQEVNLEKVSMTGEEWFNENFQQ